MSRRREETGLFHGTRAPFTQGGLVLPGETVGRENHGLGRSDVVYVTPEFDLAQEYARVATGRGRARVVEVRPCSPLRVDDSTVSGEEQESYSCEAARVLRVAWIEDRQ